ncbi:hypothetical protein FRC09_004077 [Ceratobasidium sp. 395]|nr:hypothetical protein FRC09_004077 [Ceratobasidium sp. 395]
MSSGSESDPEVSSGDNIPPSPARPRQVKGGRAWGVRESLLVAQKARQHRPWEAEGLIGGQCEAWARIAMELRDEHENFNRSGGSCQSRFDRMLRNCKAKDSLEDGIDEIIEEGRRIQAGSREQRATIGRGFAPRELSERPRVEPPQKRPPPSSNPSSNSTSMVQRKRARNSSEAESLDEALATLEAREEADDRLFEDMREEERERHKEIVEKLDGVADAIERLADVVSEDSRDTRTLLKVVNKLVTRRDAS